MPKRKRSATPDSLDDGVDDDACSLGNFTHILKCFFFSPIAFVPFHEDEKGMPIQRNAANARERARMRVLSTAFYRLKTIIPWVPRDTKLSKLDTLRLATNYISFLASTLDGEPMDVVSRSLHQPQKLVSYDFDLESKRKIIFHTSYIFYSFLRNFRRITFT